MHLIPFHEFLGFGQPGCHFTLRILENQFNGPSQDTRFITDDPTGFIDLFGRQFGSLGLLDPDCGKTAA